MENKKWLKRFASWAMIAGVLALVFYIVHDIVGGMNYPGYDRMSQAVSDLTATDAPSYQIASYYSHIYGIFSCMCCALLCVLAHDLNKTLKWGIYLFALMNFVSAIGYSLFPLSSAGYDGSFQSFMHVYVVTILVILLSIVSLILIAIGSFKSGRKALGILAIIAFVAMFFGAAGTAAFPKEVFGIIERFSTYSAVVFTAILGIFSSGFIAE